MTEDGRSGAVDGDDPWARFEERLAAYFSTMQDRVDEDRIMFYIPLSSPGAYGKIHVFTFAEGTCLQATMAGDYTTRHVSESADLARAVREVIERRYGLPHPDLVTVTAQGPASARVALLGLGSHGRVGSAAGDGLPASDPVDGGSEQYEKPHGLDAAWARLELRLAAYLSTMTDPDEGDHLVLKTPGCGEGVAPYVQFAGFADGQALRAELSGSAYVASAYQLSTAKQESLRFLGWAGNDEAEPNLFIHWSVDDPTTLAGMVAWVLRDDFQVPHPDRLTVSAWGPAAAHAGVLGLPTTADDEEADASDASAVDEFDLADLYESESDAARFASEMEAAQLLSQIPSGHDQLTAMVADALKPRFGSPLQIDEDEDFVLTHKGRYVFVRVRREEPVVELMAQVVHNVRSRRQSSLEVALLNRDHDWAKWSLRHRVVEQTLLMPAHPFSAKTFDDLLRKFLNTLDATRDDLVLRLGGPASR